MSTPAQPTSTLHSGTPGANLFGGSGGGSGAGGSGAGGSGAGTGGGSGMGGSGTGTGGSGGGGSGGSGAGTGTGTGTGGSGAGGTCFVAGTLVATPAGPRRIETLRTGDVVLAWVAGALVRRAVARLHVGASDALVDLRTASTSLVGVTPGHRLLDPDTGGWQLAGRVQVGDRLLVRAEGGHRAEEVVEVVRRASAQPVPVYNLALDGDGAFHASGVVVGQKLVARAGLARSWAAPLLGAALALSGCDGDPSSSKTTQDTVLLDTVADTDTDTDADSDADTDTDTDVDARHSAWVIC